MWFSIDPAIFQNYPALKIGAIIVRGLNNTKRVSVVEGLLRGMAAQRAKEFKDKDVYEEPMVRRWSDAYGKFGVNPKKFPPSIAALLKRVKAGKDMPHISALVDLYNYFSLKYVLPIGGEDLDWLCGDIKLTYTKGGEPFRSIGSIEVEPANVGEVAYMDNGGITCRYWNHRECERTKFTNKTVNGVIFIEDMSDMHMDAFGSIMRDVQTNLIKYIGGQIEPYIISSENPTIDLGVQGRTHADDSKVPQQEKTFFEQQQLKKKALSPVVNPSRKNSSDGEKNLFENSTLLKTKVAKILEKAVKKAYPELYISPQLTYPDSSEHGDYASNIALQLAKIAQNPPREIAETVLKNIPKNAILEKVEIAGPGFINFFLSQKTIDQEIKNILQQKQDYGSSKLGAGKNIILEYSSPNIAKPLGAQHLLSTIIGQSLYNIYKKLGFNCISDNHIGDWGTQFGKLTWAYKKWGDKKLVEKDPINELLKLYIRFHQESEKNVALEDQAREEFKKFEEGDKENRELWKWFVDESMRDVQKTYEKLGGIHFDHVLGESFYEDKMPEILEDGKKKNIFVEGEEGAYVAHFEDSNIPTTLVQKKDGTTLYVTRDLATLKYRLDRWKPYKILYFVDVAQTLHFQQVFAIAEKLDWYKGQAEHISFGRMSLKDGNMSTRKGTLIKLDEVLSQGIDRAMRILFEKNPDSSNKGKISHVIGVGAVKYNILSQNRTTDITFDWDRMLSLESNSAPYLQYSYARAKSILRKALELSEAVKDQQDTEKRISELVRFLPKYPEAIISAASEYKPNLLCNYLYELAQKFNSFYNSVPVLRAEKKSDREHRLQIVEAAAEIFKGGLKLIGVEVVEEM